MVDRVPLQQEKTSEAPAQNNVFVQGAMWEVLKPSKKEVVDPLKTMFREPTMSEDMADLEFENIKKFDYDEHFDRPEFTGTYFVSRLNRYGKPMHDKTTKKPIYDEKKRTNGRPKDDFLSDHNFDHTTLPHEWFDAFLPLLW